MRGRGTEKERRGKGKEQKRKEQGREERRERKEEEKAIFLITSDFPPHSLTNTFLVY